MDDGGHLDFQNGRIGMTLKPSVTIYGPPPLLQLDNSTIESNCMNYQEYLLFWAIYKIFFLQRGTPLQSEIVK
jgi:hypothetical protein